MIFDIQKFSLNDGPGIRTTVFMKGCPLDCVWCHNPESKKYERELSFNRDKCVGCRTCVTLCSNKCHEFSEKKHRINRSLCVACGKCIPDDCNALEIIGKRMDVAEIINEVIKDKSFYETSGGGLTISGGEPMSDFPFAFDLAKRAKELNIHVCLETCGYAPISLFLKIMPYIDIFLFDFKEINDNYHVEYTGVSNKLILENLLALDSSGAKIILRCPLIPGYNDRPEHLNGIITTASLLQNLLEIHLLPYHPLGEQKGINIGKESLLRKTDFADKNLMTSWKTIISKNITVPIIVWK